MYAEFYACCQITHSRFLFRVVMSAAIPALNDVRFVYTLVCYGEVYCFIYVICIY